MPTAIEEILIQLRLEDKTPAELTKIRKNFEDLSKVKDNPFMGWQQGIKNVIKDTKTLEKLLVESRKNINANLKNTAGGYDDKTAKYRKALEKGKESKTTGDEIADSSKANTSLTSAFKNVEKGLNDFYGVLLTVTMNIGKLFGKSLGSSTKNSSDSKDKESSQPYKGKSKPQKPDPLYEPKKGKTVQQWAENPANFRTSNALRRMNDEVIKMHNESASVTPSTPGTSAFELVKKQQEEHQKELNELSNKGKLEKSEEFAKAKIFPESEVNKAIKGSYGVVQAVQDMDKAQSKWGGKLKQYTTEQDSYRTNIENVRESVNGVLKPYQDYSKASTEAIKADTARSKSLKGMNDLFTKTQDSSKLALNALKKNMSGEVTPSYTPSGSIKENIGTALRTDQRYNREDFVDNLPKHYSPITYTKEQKETAENLRKDQSEFVNSALNWSRQQNSTIIPSLNKSSKAISDEGKAMNTVNASTKAFTTTQKTFNKTMESTGQYMPMVINSMGNLANSASSLGQPFAYADYSTKTATLSLSNLADTFGKLGDALNPVQDMITRFFGIVGSGSITMDLLTNASSRQTNQIMLNARRGDKAGQELYNTIQDLVISLPGNDDFLNQLLTQSATMYENIGTEELTDIGTAVANYYMLARAKGQTNFETEREIRGYLLTGSTLAFRNSVLSSEIDTLEKANNVTERAIALQEGMEKIGMDSIAQYDSYVNTLERFKGRFQKAFADMGYAPMIVLQKIMDLYTFVDSITFSGLSWAVIALGALITSFITIITGLGVAFRLAQYGLEGFMESIRLVRSVQMALDQTKTLTDAIKMIIGAENAQTIAEVRNWFAKKLGISASVESAGAKTADAGASALVADAEATEATSKGITVSAIISTIWSRITSIGTKVAEAFTTYTVIQAEGMEGEIRVRNIFARAVEVGWTWSSIVAKGIEKAKDIASAVAKGINTIATWLHTISKGEEAVATELVVITKAEDATATGILSMLTMDLAFANMFLTMTLEPILVALGLTLGQFLLIIAVIGAVVVGLYMLNDAFDIVGKIKGVIDVITGGIMRLWDAFVNSEPVVRVIDYFDDFFTTLQSFFQIISKLSILEGLFAVFTGTFDNPVDGEEWDIIGDIIGLFESFGNAVMWVYDILADFFDNNPIGMIISWQSPLGILLFHLDEIGAILEWVMLQWNAFFDSAEMQDLKDAFADLREVFGEVFGELWDAISEIGRVVMEVFGELFGDAQPSGNNLIMDTLDNSDLLLDSLKAVAVFIKNDVVPVIRAVAGFIKDYVVPIVRVLAIVIGYSLVAPIYTVVKVVQTIIGVLTWFANGISFIINLLTNFDSVMTNVATSIVNSFLSLPSRVMNIIGTLITSLVNEFLSIPSRILGAIAEIPQKVFGGLVDGVLNILGIHSPGFIQTAVVGEFLAIPSRILGGIGNLMGAVGSFANALLNPFDTIFGTDFGNIINGFFNRLTSSFQKLSEGDILGAIRDFGTNFLNTFDDIFNTDISGMVDGFINQTMSNFERFKNGDIRGIIDSTGTYFNESIKRFTGVDLSEGILNFRDGLRGVLGFNNNPLNQWNSQELMRQEQIYSNPNNNQLLFSEGLMRNPNNLATGQTLTQTYNNNTNNTPTIVNNNFSEGSVKADARNMSDRDVQKMFTSAFGYNKSRGVRGFLS